MAHAISIVCLLVFSTNYVNSIPNKSQSLNPNLTLNKNLNVNIYGFVDDVKNDPCYKKVEAEALKCINDRTIIKDKVSRKVDLYGLLTDEMCCLLFLETDCPTIAAKVIFNHYYNTVLLLHFTKINFNFNF
jgi:hypothetical protein